MSITIIESTTKTKGHKKHRNVEEKKQKILKRLQKAIEKLQEARKEIHEIVQITLQMKEDGDDIADAIMIGISEVFTSYDNVPFLGKNINQNN